MKRCAHCGTELPDQYRFCPNCGVLQDADEAVPGGSPPLQSHLTGPGAIAQGVGATAAGQDGMAVAGSVGGDALGAGARKEVHYHAHGPKADRLAPAAMRAAYLNRVLEATSHLSLAGVDPKAASESEARLDLGAVYNRPAHAYPRVPRPPDAW